MNRPNAGSLQIPASVLGMAASRRNVLRGGLLGGALLELLHASSPRAVATAAAAATRRVP